jgi:hypothetical protein
MFCCEFMPLVSVRHSSPTLTREVVKVADTATAGVRLHEINVIGLLAAKLNKLVGVVLEGCFESFSILCVRFVSLQDSDSLSSKRTTLLFEFLNRSWVLHEFQGHFGRIAKNWLCIATNSPVHVCGGQWQVMGFNAVGVFVWESHLLLYGVCPHPDRRKNHHFRRKASTGSCGGPVAVVCSWKTNIPRAKL